MSRRGRRLSTRGRRPLATSAYTAFLVVLRTIATSSTVSKTGQVEVLASHLAFVADTVVIDISGIPESSVPPK
jgi:hypothetical protein